MICLAVGGNKNGKLKCASDMGLNFTVRNDLRRFDDVKNRKQVLAKTKKN